MSAAQMCGNTSWIARRNIRRLRRLHYSWLIYIYLPTRLCSKPYSGGILGKSITSESPDEPCSIIVWAAVPRSCGAPRQVAFHLAQPAVALSQAVAGSIAGLTHRQRGMCIGGREQMTAPKVTDPFAECVATWCQGLRKLPFHPSFSLLESLFGNLLGSWWLFVFSQNHKDWGIYRDHHPSSVIPHTSSLGPRQCWGEWRANFILPFLFAYLVLFCWCLRCWGLGRSFFSVPVPPVCCLWKTVSSPNGF